MKKLRRKRRTLTERISKTESEMKILSAIVARLEQTNAVSKITINKYVADYSSIDVQALDIPQENWHEVQP